MILTSSLINDFFNDDFATSIKSFNNYSTSNVTHDDDGATIKLKVPGFNKKSIDISVEVIDVLLTLTLPYKAEVKPRKIKVN